MDLQLSNEARVVALAVETSYFVFPNGLILNFIIVILFQYFKILFPFNLLLNRFKFIIKDKYCSFKIIMFLWIQ
jgi:hypothetical protein